ncbi:MAG TPA: glycosyltransferase family 2 protein [Ferruginibacter sp.]|nr:glycosyltransferase family 2 protein [Ferruginibacter sp.]
MQPSLTILIPVYNDFASLRLLLQEFDSLLARSYALDVVVIDDASPESNRQLPGYSFKLTVLRLIRNLGHQQAIAIGLSYIRDRKQSNIVVVMDGDGEDKVSDIPSLLAQQKSGEIVFARRQKRHAGLFFQLGYWFYQILFFGLTGKRIKFGNFSCLPASALNPLTHYSELWNNYPGTVLKSGIPNRSVPLDRGKRLAGQSKMNLTALILHGVGSMAVFTELIITRILIFSFGLMSLSLLSLFIILLVKLGTSWAIPGWASTVGSSVFIIFLISLLLSLLSLFIFFSSRQQQRSIPATDYRLYLEDPEMH